MGVIRSSALLQSPTPTPPLKGRGLILLIACLSLLFSAPLYAAPKQSDIEAYRALVALDKRIATTGYRLAKANAPFCKKKQRNPGWVLHSYRQYPDRDTARTAFSFRTAVSIAALVDGGPADKAGLRPGDGVYHLGNAISLGTDRKKHRPSNETTNWVQADIARLLAQSGPVNLGFQTVDGPRDFALDPPYVCASDFVISTGSKADAGADGQRVRISAKLAEFTPDEDEFAAIVAHELAHNILEHRAFLNAHNVKRGLGRMFGKSKRLIRQTEVEADRLSIWLMANAGYDPEAALRFIERYGRKFGYGFFSDGTHYRWRKRREIMAEEIAILRRTARGEAGFAPPLLKSVTLGGK